jgi:hypothetical protein
MPDAFQYQAASGKVTGYQGNQMRLDELETRIHKAVTK